MNWLKFGGYILIIIPTLFVGVALTLYLLQDYMIFLGERLPETHKYNFNLPHEEFDLVNKNGVKINCLLFKAPNSKGLVYYHHGNAGNIQGWGTLAANFVKNKFDVLFYDYRGYGKSTGKISAESQLHSDARFVLKEFLKSRSYAKIIYYGTSLGSGIASALARKIPPDALILETPYYSFLSLIHYHYPLMPASLLSKYKIRTYRSIKNLECPILIFHGTDDELVPYENSVKLSKITDRIQFVGIKGGVHNNLPDFKIYQVKLSVFLNDI